MCKIWSKLGVGYASAEFLYLPSLAFYAISLLSSLSFTLAVERTQLSLFHNFCPFGLSFLRPTCFLLLKQAKHSRTSPHVSLQFSVWVCWLFLIFHSEFLCFAFIFLKFIKFIVSIVLYAHKLVCSPSQKPAIHD